MLRNFKLIDKCPKPIKDTGCTFCKVHMNQPINQGNLNNTSPAPWKHVLILSHGYNTIDDLPPNIYKTDGIAKQLRNLHLSSGQTMHPVLFSHIFPYNFKENIPKNSHVVYLYPNNVRVEFESQHLQQFHDHYLTSSSETTISNPFKKVSKEMHHTTQNVDTSIFQETALCDPLYMACGHGSRDERCGKSAPYILQEFQTICNPKEKLAYISHIGGHAYAGNVIIYPENIWYGRVLPDKVQGLYHSYHNNQIIKELYRGQV